jgi:hypothetical protein
VKERIKPRNDEHGPYFEKILVSRTFEIPDCAPHSLRECAEIGTVEKNPDLLAL